MVGSDSLFGLVEMILKNRARLHKIIRDPARQPQLIPRLLAISVTAFAFFGAAMAVVLTSTHSWPHLLYQSPVADELPGLATTRLADQRQPDGIDYQAVEPARERDGNILEPTNRRDDLATPGGLPQRLASPAGIPDPLETKYHRYQPLQNQRLNYNAGNAPPPRLSTDAG